MIRQKGKNRKLSNIIMAILIVLIVLCGIMAVGNLKGWFGGNNETDITSGEIKGVAYIQRSGVGYSLDENLPIKNKDIIETRNESTASLEILKDATVTMDENSEIAAVNSIGSKVELSLNTGDGFVSINEENSGFKVDFGKNNARLSKGTYYLTSRQGSWQINVLEGKTKVALENGESASLNAGEVCTISHNNEGKSISQIEKIDITNLSDFAINEAMACKGKDSLCFTVKELKTTLDKREKERLKAEKTANAKAAEEAITLERKSEGSGEKSSASQKGEENKISSCNISISCKGILNHMDSLAPGKDKFVPSNGIILSSSVVEFREGETAFDALKRACSYAGIQLEYSYTPAYGSYYIEGINNLYEFDCGSQSGWKYKVNGWSPNYGCSQYKLKKGDSLVFYYDVR